MLNSDDPGPEYALRWPRALLLTELEEVVALTEDRRRNIHLLREALPRLLREAFAGPTPLGDLRDAEARQRQEVIETGFKPDPDRIDRVAEFAALLRSSGDRLPQQQPRRYWHQRQDGVGAHREPRDRQLDLQNGWLSILFDLTEAGYLDEATRPDDRDAASRDRRLARLVAEETAIAPHHWPRDGKLYETPEDEDLFYGLVEAVHQLVARPRTAFRDSEGETRTNHFSRSTGQAVYRWRVNTLLTEQDTDLELAETGEDQGLLVHRTADGRQQLFDQARQHVVDGNQARIDHAITLFRRRTATLEDKRSACKALADVLEHRRTFIKANFHDKDEGDLFNIANNFGIRHHDGKQRIDYPEEYLDWIFWWYLATVDLTNRLMTRAKTGV